ncbi:MAG: hypothetical protein ACRDHX_03690 [Chloroflexota bacterium]
MCDNTWTVDPRLIHGRKAAPIDVIQQRQLRKRPADCAARPPNDALAGGHTE